MMCKTKAKLKVTEVQWQEFETLTRPVVDWLKENFQGDEGTAIIGPNGVLLTGGGIDDVMMDFLVGDSDGASRYERL